MAIMPDPRRRCTLGSRRLAFTMSLSPTRRLRCTSRTISPRDALWASASSLSYAHGGDVRELSSAWVTATSQVLGWGVATTLRLPAGGTLADASSLWRDFVAGCETTHPADVMGFVSTRFDENQGESGGVIVVPEVVVRVTDGCGLVSTISGHAADELAASPIPHDVSSDMGNATYRTAVARATKDMRDGLLDKVVVARRERVTWGTPLTAANIVRNLTQKYPSCWSFLVDNLVGATPELLVRKRSETGGRSHVSSRVLAGTVAGNSDANVARLLGSDKDRREHDVALTSLVEGFRKFTDSPVVEPSTAMRLANVSHLATTVRATLDDTHHTVLDLAGCLHPTAAVCGTPTSTAREFIATHEGFDRGRYAGPVGWIDGGGDGELGLALRCGLLDNDLRGITLYAGGGVMPDSTVDSEFAETEVKLQPMRNAVAG